MSDSILVIAAHPDDEVLGCGGAIAMHSEKGDNVNILIVGEKEQAGQDVTWQRYGSKERQTLPFNAFLKFASTSLVGTFAARWINKSKSFFKIHFLT